MSRTLADVVAPAVLPPASPTTTTTSTAIADWREQIGRAPFDDLHHDDRPSFWRRRSGSFATAASAGSFLHPAARSGEGLVQSPSPAPLPSAAKNARTESGSRSRMARSRQMNMSGLSSRLQRCCASARRLEWAVAEHAIHESDHPEGEPTGQRARRVRGAHGSSTEQSPLIAERKRIGRTPDLCFRAISYCAYDQKSHLGCQSTQFMDSGASTKRAITQPKRCRFAGLLHAAVEAPTPPFALPPRPCSC